ncbi:RagB/SusD family nutrient uptake outer membrane protein [Rhabdobacter roseus]|uniref:RagB/SusD family nutrient uptake outer membrane protein n=1 Tax=Rhabdobacter roseus TaxID=1655419 RepID=A0A840TWQ9_9BACT|nr:RagB/SusD family nutrient uptake outer membrane protein [Rhabdobacter roseus]MBB5284079.1 hypothetical protein [Rhabdobacter roseus]
MKKIFLSIVLLGSLVGCSDSFLDLRPITSPSSDNYYLTPQDFLTAVNAAYGGLRNAGLANSDYRFGDMTTDVTFSNGANCLGGDCDFDNFNLFATGTAAANQINNRWSSAYRGIARTNIILDRIDAITMDATLKNRYKGEALFLRAYYYYTLVTTFGDVPLVINEVASVEDSYQYGRESAAKVFAQIEQDLKTAAGYLPATYANAEKGRATSGAANGMLGRVLLFQRKFAEALPVLKTVIDSKTFSLLPNYANVFAANNGNNAEILFSVQYAKGGIGQGNNFTTSFIPQGSGNVIQLGGGAGANQPTNDIVAAYEAGDTRKAASLATSYTLNGREIQYNYIRKFIDPAMTAVNESGTDWPVLRYADILLMYAECLNETGQTAEALPYINQVRARAGLPPLAAMAQAELRLALEHERMVEFAFEGLRFYDLVRTNRLVPVMNEYFRKNNLLLDGKLIQITENNRLFPIPQIEIDANPTRITQNPGYL